jgi:hypothetical protein
MQKWNSKTRILFLALKLVKSANVGQKMSSKIRYEYDRTQLRWRYRLVAWKKAKKVTHKKV